MKLSDGTVLASAYRAQPAQTAHGIDHVKKADRLKIGTIVAVRTVDASEGLQKSAVNSDEGQEGTPYETVYDVRVDDHNARPFIFNGCRALKPFMGANNYFDIIHESADISPTYIEQGPISLFTAAAESLVGSRCVILCVEGEPSAPIILGFLQHPARTSKITEDMGLHMEFEFNGFKCSIDKDGAFLIEANGPYIDPIAPPIGPVPDSSIRQNPIAGPFSISLDADMVFSIFDNMGQTFTIDRGGPTIQITNGSEDFTMSLTDASISMSVGQTFSVESSMGDYFEVSAPNGIQGSTPAAGGTSFSFKSGNVDITSANASFSMSQSGDVSFDGTTFAIAAQTSFSVDATTVAIKGKTGELLDLINQLITALGAITVASPTGPCAPIQGAPQWAQVQAQLVKLQGMMG